MKIEVLYPELCNLNGDLGNIRYLEQCIPESQFIYTSILDVPRFVKDDINFIYMGPMSEESQELVLKKLKPYKKRIKGLIDNNTLFLITGNALDLFGNYIKYENREIECLKIFDFHVERDMFNRHNSLCLGDFENMEIVGFKSQFTWTYGDNTDNYFIKVKRGYGINKDSKYEGIHVNNFFGTNLLGPILIMNPYFTKHILKLLGIKNPKLKFEKETIDAYNQRLSEFKDLNKKID